MKIEIVTKHIESDQAVREFTDRKIHFALDRIKERIRRVIVKIEDQTKDSPRFVGHCQIDVRLKPKGHVHISSDGDSVFDTVLQATRKMEHVIKHEIDRHRRAAQIRHQHLKQDIRESLEAGATLHVSELCPPTEKK